jgi:hypothetical protein
MPQQVYELVGFDQPAPELPEYVRRWKESVQLSRDEPAKPH